MSKKNEVNISGILEKNRVIAHIENLVKSFKENTVYIQQGNEFVALSPAEHIDFEMEATQKKNKESLSIKLSWKKIESLEEEHDVVISGNKPAIATDISSAESSSDEA